MIYIHTGVCVYVYGGYLVTRVGDWLSVCVCVCDVDTSERGRGGGGSGGLVD